MTMKRAVLMGILCVSVMTGGSSNAEDSMPSLGSVCWPLHFAGITLGVSTDSQVQRLLGHGVVRKNEGDTGGRYFTDAKGTATLHLVEYTDNVVGELTVSAGIDRAIKPSEQQAAVTKWFTPDEGFGNWHALHLGSSKDDVLKNLGKPKRRLSPDEWVYETSCSCEIQDSFRLVFKDGRLKRIVFSAPAG